MRRRDDTLPLRATTADALRAFLTNKAPAAQAFNLPVEYEVADMLRADLADAGIPATDDAGRVVDFHALRHTFITNLASGGVHPKIAQSLARHSTITLTMDRYTHSLAGDEVSALEALPDLSAGPNHERAKATGTHDAAPTLTDARSSSSPKQRVLGATGRNGSEPIAATNESGKGLETGASCNVAQRLDMKATCRT
ncbi:MAG: tyrosine-type recombinase/integrase [Phycisphaeraceae bacterium]